MPVITGSARRRREPAAGRTEVAPGERGLAPTPAGDSMTAEAATVATRARSGVTSPLPSGCTRFDRNTTNMPRRRIDPDRRAGEAGVAERADRQQLAAIRRERGIDVPAEAADVPVVARRPGVVIFATASGDSTRVPRYAPPPEQHAAEDRQVGGRAEQPAWPATPPIRRAVGSCTMPRSIVISGPSHGQPYGVQLSVGAIAGAGAAAGSEHRVLHPERLEDLLASRTVERHAADAADDVAEQEEVDVAVDERACPAGRSAPPRSPARSPCPIRSTRPPDRRPAAGPTCASSDDGW